MDFRIDMNIVVQCRATEGRWEHHSWDAFV